jgi:hypothetical protein
MIPELFYINRVWGDSALNSRRAGLTEEEDLGLDHYRQAELTHEASRLFRSARVFQ